jgi:hypothetical protein
MMWQIDKAFVRFPAENATIRKCLSNSKFILEKHGAAESRRVFILKTNNQIVIEWHQGPHRT